jgi:hypothetical protein
MANQAKPQLHDISELERIAGIRSRIAALAELLGPDELAVLELVGNGLARGRTVYGELAIATDRRDFRAEAGDELRDALVYVACELLRLRKGSDPRCR